MCAGRYTYIYIYRCTQHLLSRFTPSTQTRKLDHREQPYPKNSASSHSWAERSAQKTIRATTIEITQQSKLDTFLGTGESETNARQQHSATHSCAGQLSSIIIARLIFPRGKTQCVSMRAGFVIQFKHTYILGIIRIRPEGAAAQMAGGPGHIRHRTQG